jgi:hypothetical protein
MHAARAGGPSTAMQVNLGLKPNFNRVDNQRKMRA